LQIADYVSNLQSAVYNLQSAMDLLWLGYDGLAVRYVDVVAVLFYRPDLDGRIIRDYGRVPINVRAVVVTSDGVFWPSSWRADQLRRRWSRWRRR
jgi:hypothetical protein